MAKYIAFLTLVLAWAVYFSVFDPLNGFPMDKSEWGTFGDFIGGVSNPILTFITIIMLIKSIKLQHEANLSILKQNEQIQEDSARQKEIDDLRSFESSFYDLAELSRQNFTNMVITSSTKKEYSAEHAVTYIEKHLINLCKAYNAKELKDKLLKLDDDSSLAIYSAVRSFYVLHKFTNEACPRKYQDRYYDICNYTMPVKFLHLVCICYVFVEWDILKKLNESGFYKRKGIAEYVSSFERVRNFHK